MSEPIDPAATLSFTATNGRRYSVRRTRIDGEVWWYSFEAEDGSLGGGFPLVPDSAKCKGGSGQGALAQEAAAHVIEKTYAWDVRTPGDAPGTSWSHEYRDEASAKRAEAELRDKGIKPEVVRRTL